MPTMPVSRPVFIFPLISLPVPSLDRLQLTSYSHRALHLGYVLVVICSNHLESKRFSSVLVVGDHPWSSPPNHLRGRCPRRPHGMSGNGELVESGRSRRPRPSGKSRFRGTCGPDNRLLQAAAS